METELASSVLAARVSFEGVAPSTMGYWTARCMRSCSRSSPSVAALLRKAGSVAICHRRHRLSFSAMLGGGGTPAMRLAEALKLLGGNASRRIAPPWSRSGPTSWRRWQGAHRHGSIDGGGGASRGRRIGMLVPIAMGPSRIGRQSGAMKFRAPFSVVGTPGTELLAFPVELLVCRAGDPVILRRQSFNRPFANSLCLGHDRSRVAKRWRLAFRRTYGGGDIACCYA